MNHFHFSLSDNAAKIVGGVIPFTVASLLVADGTPSLFRMSSSVIVCLMSMLITYTLLHQLRNKNIGHKPVLTAQCAFFAWRIFLHGNAAYLAYKGHSPFLPIWQLFIGNVTETIFGLYFYASRQDLETTYERSEKRRQANLENLKELQQATSQILYAAQMRPGVQKSGKEMEHADAL